MLQYDEMTWKFLIGKEISQKEEFYKSLEIYSELAIERFRKKMTLRPSHDPVPSSIGDHLLDLLSICTPKSRFADGKDRGGPSIVSTANCDHCTWDFSLFSMWRLQSRYIPTLEKRLQTMNMFCHIYLYSMFKAKAIHTSFFDHCLYTWEIPGILPDHWSYVTSNQLRCLCSQL